MRSNISPEVRGFLYAASGDNDWDGRSPELPKRDIQVALDAAVALTPTPTPFISARVKEAQGGIYSEDLILYESVLFEGAQTTIVSSGPVGVAAASFVSFNPQTLVNNTGGATLLLIDGVESFGCDMAALIVGGDNAIGVELSGALDAIFLDINQLSIGGDGTTGVEVTGTSPTPPDINLETVSFGGDNETFFNYNPANATDVLDLSVSTLSDANGTTHTGTTGLAVRAGTLKVLAGSLVATEVAHVYAGGTLGLSAIALGGDTIVEAGGAAIYSAVGLLVGDLETSGNGTLQVSSETVIGDVTNAGGMSLKTDQLIGDIDNDGTLFAIINSHVGSITGSGVINGRINGHPYGNWVDQIISVEALSPSATNAPYDPITGALAVDEDFDVPIAGEFLLFLSFTGSAASNNRSLVVGWFLDDVLIVDEYTKEPKDPTDLNWPSKQIRVPALSAGTHNLKVRFGKAGGAGGSLVQVEEIRFYATRVRSS